VYYSSSTDEWNSKEVSVKNRIYPKVISHFIRYVKQFKKNQDRRDAEIASGANKLSDALEYVPDMPAVQNFEPTPIDISTPSNDPTDTVAAQSASTTDDVVVEPLQMLCQVVATAEAIPPPPIEIETTATTKRKRKRPTCQGPSGDGDCPRPDICTGFSDRENCYAKT